MRWPSRALPWGRRGWLHDCGWGLRAQLCVQFSGSWQRHADKHPVEGPALVADARNGQRKGSLPGSKRFCHLQEPVRHGRAVHACMCRRGRHTWPGLPETRYFHTVFRKEMHEKRRKTTLFRKEMHEKTCATASKKNVEPKRWKKYFWSRAIFGARCIGALARSFRLRLAVRDAQAPSCEASCVAAGCAFNALRGCFAYMRLTWQLPCVRDVPGTCPSIACASSAATLAWDDAWHLKNAKPASNTLNKGRSNACLAQRPCLNPPQSLASGKFPNPTGTHTQTPQIDIRHR